jgi:uncharacterized protein
MTMTELMNASPYDTGVATPTPVFVPMRVKSKPRWIPSRYNARTVGDDGRLILWNTLRGTISVFQAKDAPTVLTQLAPSGLDAPLDKFGEYLSRRGYLIRDDTNEMNIFRMKYGQQQHRSDTLQFHLLASEDCNFRCVYCYEKFRRGTMLPSVRAGIKKWVTQRAPKLNDLQLSWFGGEPLYGWEAVRELAPFFKSISEQYGIRFGHGMTTNGYLLTAEKADLLLASDCRFFQITLDGLPEEHDCKRVGRDGSPTYGTILENLRGLGARDEQFTVVIRVNYDNSNSPRLEEFLESLSKDFGGDKRFEMHFRAVGKWGGSRDNELSTCGVTEERAVLRRLQEKAQAVGLHQEGGIEEVAMPGSAVCYAARPYNFIVGSTGNLMKCTVALDDMPANMVGQLHEDGTITLNQENMSKWTAPHYEDDELCQSCYVLPTCQGAACPLTRLDRGERTCCRTKTHLKHEMRVSLAKGTQPIGRA